MCSVQLWAQPATWLLAGAEAQPRAATIARTRVASLQRFWLFISTPSGTGSRAVPTSIAAAPRAREETAETPAPDQTSGTGQPARGRLDSAPAGASPYPCP